MKDNRSLPNRNRHIVVIAVVIFTGITLSLIWNQAQHYPSIARIYTPGRATITRVERRKVRKNKRTETIDFYDGHYVVEGRTYRTQFATKPGVYRTGDTVRLLYNPQEPAAHLIYDRRSGAIHLVEGGSLQKVNIDYNDVVRLFDSIDGGGAAR